MSRFGLIVGTFAALALGASPAAAESVRIGYWSSGVSLGFGSVLEAGKFMEKEGLSVEYVKFPDVNAPTKALAAGAIDFAIGASAGTAFSVVTEGCRSASCSRRRSPISTSSSRRIADHVDGGTEGQEDRNVPAGSATAAISAAILEKNFGIKPSDYQEVPGNDSRLAQFLVQKEIDAAALRTVTLALLPDASCGTSGPSSSNGRRSPRRRAARFWGSA